MSEGYTKDHLNVLLALGTEIPKRPTLSTKEIVKAKFSKTDKGDRIVRNAYRKLRDRGLVEISEKGQYRLTTSGASVVKTCKEKGMEGVLQERKPREKKEPSKKAAPKKDTKKVVAPKKAETKKAAPKPAPKAKAEPKKAAPKKAATVKEKPAAKVAPKKASALGQTPKTTTAKAAKAPEKHSSRPSNGTNGKSKLSAALPKKVEPKNDKPESVVSDPKPTLPM